ncbi:MAG: hypothetical protein KDA79_06840 [Planctomycetaceae bacterium]|nr:hypothetical protein [Planctomycetaceae bacterium]
MRIEQLRILLSPRTVASCLDLAFLFYGRHLRQMLGLWAAVAVPVGLAVWLLTTRAEITVFGISVLLLLATMPLGTLTALWSIPAVFGEPFSLETLNRQVRLHCPVLLLQGLLQRAVVGLGLVLLVLPGMWLAVRFGFLVEKRCLVRLGRYLHHQQADDMIRAGTVDLMVRSFWISAFCGMLTVVVSLTVDVLLEVLAGSSVLLRPALHESGILLDGLGQILYDDPAALTLVSVCFLLVYPLGRLAWFFCYVDLRVRQDCWDMELRMRKEARELRRQVAPVNSH